MHTFLSAFENEKLKTYTHLKKIVRCFNEKTNIMDTCESLCLFTRTCKGTNFHDFISLYFDGPVHVRADELTSYCHL